MSLSRKSARFDDDGPGIKESKNSQDRSNRGAYPEPKNRRKTQETSRNPMRSGSGQECSLITSGSSIQQSRTERTSTTEKALSSGRMVNSRNVYDVHHHDVDLTMSESSSGFSRRNEIF